MTNIKMGIKQYRLYLWIGLCSFFLMLLFILIDTQIFSVIGRYFFEEGYMDIVAYECNLVGFPVPGNFFEFFIWFIDIGRWQFDYSIIFGTNLFQILLPLFGSIAAYRFYNEHHSVYNFTMCKAKTYRGFILKKMSKNAALMGTALFAGFILYYLVILSICGGSFTESDGPLRELFLDILGKDFYGNHTYFYYILEGFLRFFMMPFVYAFFGQAVVLLANHRKIVLLAPCLYYFGLTLIGSGLMVSPFYEAAIYVAPNIIMASGDYNDINTPLILLTNFVPLFIGIFIVLKRTRHAEL